MTESTICVRRSCAYLPKDGGLIFWCISYLCYHQPQYLQDYWYRSLLHFIINSQPKSSPSLNISRDPSSASCIAQSPLPDWSPHPSGHVPDRKLTLYESWWIICGMKDGLVWLHRPKSAKLRFTATGFLLHVMSYVSQSSAPKKNVQVEHRVTTLGWNPTHHRSLVKKNPQHCRYSLHAACQS